MNVDYGRFVPMHFRSRERNDHTMNVRSRERTCGRFVPGNETTIQSAVYTVVEVTDESRPLRRAAFYMEISNNDLGQFYHTERPHCVQRDAHM